VKIFLLNISYLCIYDLYSPVHNVLDACIPITCASVRGVGPWKLRVWVPKWHLPTGSMPFHRAQKTLDFQGPTPSHLPSERICMHPKHYARDCINHKCIRGFMYKSPKGRFKGSNCGGWGSRCIKELNPPAWATPPITKHFRNQEEIVRYIICASGAHKT
jgi:hypothetical protein